MATNTKEGQEGKGQEGSLPFFMGERNGKVHDLSRTINRMIIDFEKKNNTKVICSSHAAMQYPEQYPDEPKIQLFEIL